MKKIVTIAAIATTALAACNGGQTNQTSNADTTAS